jgi:molybdopterin molybdotransferase
MTTEIIAVSVVGAMADLLTIDAALAAVLERAHPLPSELVPLEQASGRYLAEDLQARVDLPPFPSSAMDGYAVHAADTPGRLPVAFRIAAGRPAPDELAAGEAMAIATGGMVPPGADAVIPVEYVVENENDVQIDAAAEAGRHVRPQGGDVRRGDVVLSAGLRLTPARIGALAAAGVDEVRCARRARAAVLTTGTELRAVGERLEPGQIYESNGPMLAALLADAGADVERLTPVADDPGAHRDAIARALESDMAVTSGGVSVGPHDLVRGVARELGVDEVFWGVAMRPGKPLVFGVRGETLVFGLPGNPVSALVGAELFVRPALLALHGDPSPGLRWQGGTLAVAVRRNAARDELLRSRTTVVDGRVSLEPVSGQESHMIARAAAADALVHVPRGDGELAAGEPVRYLAIA